MRLLFAMGSWPAFANGVPNTICGRPRLDVRLVVWPAQFGSISIRRRCSQLVAQVPQQHSADEQMQCLIKHSDWFAARDLRGRTATGFICKRLNQNETEQSQWSRSACTPNCTWTPANVRQFQAQGKRGILTMGDNYKWNNVYSVPCAVYVVQLGTGRQAPGSLATRQPGNGER